MRAEPFGETPIGPVQKLVIGSEPGPVLEVLDLGATVHRLWVTGGDGVRRNVVLGHATPQEYLESADYVGGTIGRYANRIRGGRFVLDGETVQLATNESGNTLHGGPEGFDKRVWQVVDHNDDQLALTLTSPAGDQGFPGELIVVLQIEATDESVRLSYEARTDAPTVVSLTNHAYFNLDGDGSGSVADHLLLVAADEYLPVDEAGLPTAVTPVDGTELDLRRPTHLAHRLANGGFDDTFVLGAQGPHPVATIASESTRTRMDLFTDRPGLQVYTANAFDGSRRSTGGQPYLPGAGVALESQLFPDTPNRPDLGSAVLRPGETWRSWTELRFRPLS